MIQNLFLISLTSAVIIAVLLLLFPCTEKICSAKWRVLIWIVLAIRLLIPYRMEFKTAPIQLSPVQDRPITYAYVPEQPDTERQLPSENTEREVQPSIELQSKQITLTLYDAILIGWAVGAVLFFGYHIGSYLWFVLRMRKKAVRMQADSNLPVYMCNEIGSPMLYGYFKTKILLPHNAYEEQDISMILRHEAMHHKHGDLWIKLLLLLANAVHWFNPLVYIMVRRANRDLEYACDDALLRDMPQEYRKSYAKTILKTMEEDKLRR